MRVGFLSDTHGDLEAIRKALQLLEDCEVVFHCGDVLYHGVFNPILSSYSPLEAAEAINDSKLQIIFSRGNCDSEVDQLAIKRPILNRLNVSKIGSYTFFVHHGDRYSDDYIVSLARQSRNPIAVSGHTHVRRFEVKENVVFINPGSPSLPKGDKQKSLAILEDDLLRFLGLDGEEIEAHRLPF